MRHEVSTMHIIFKYIEPENRFEDFEVSDTIVFFGFAQMHFREDAIDALVRQGVISREDLDLFQLLDSVGEAFDFITSELEKLLSTNSAVECSGCFRSPAPYLQPGRSLPSMFCRRLPVCIYGRQFHPLGSLRRLCRSGILPLRRTALRA